MVYRNGEWIEIGHPVWDIHSVYRQAATKPNIVWSHVSDDLIALATGSAGFTHLFSERPSKDTHGWFGGNCTSVEAFASFCPGTCHWEDSLVMRPGFEGGRDD